MAARTVPTATDDVTSLNFARVGRYDVVLPTGIQLFPAQRTAIEQLFHTLDGSTAIKRRLLLSCPTGFGKTMCYVSSLLAWHDERKEAWLKSATSHAGSQPPPKLLLLSRTHSQLDGVMRAIKDLAYVYSDLAVTRLSARQKRLCSLEHVSSSPDITQACREARSASACRYHRALQQELATATR